MAANTAPTPEYSPHFSPILSMGGIRGGNYGN